jgi:hypothetical protein
MFSPIFDDEFILQLYFIGVLLHDIFLVVTLISEFCYYLKIRPFVIPYNTSNEEEGNPRLFPSLLKYF